MNKNILVHTETLPSQESISKSTEYGSGIIVKIFDEKIIVCAENTTRIKQGNFLLEGKEIVIEGEKGIKISSRHPNILVISCDTTKQEERIFDLTQEVNKRLEVIEKVFSKIIKQVKT